jgi:hypothetical protein
MTTQVDTHSISASSQTMRFDDFDGAPLGVLLGARMAAGEITVYRPAHTAATVEPDLTETVDAEINIFAPQVGLRNKITAYRSRRRLNRSFRRDQREFDNVLDAVAHDPAGQRELKTIWTIGR